MANKLYEESNIQAIANAIRTKKEEPSSVKYTVADMAQGVLDIPAGPTPTGTIQLTDNGTYDVTDYAEAVVNVSGGEDLVINDCGYLFYSGNRNSSQTELDKYMQKVKNVNDTQYMFYNCTRTTFTSFTWPSTATVSNLTSAYNMFYGCSRLTNVNLANLDLSKATSVGQLFYSCGALANLTLPTQLTSTTNAGAMFRGCNSLANTNIADIKFSANGVNISQMFYGIISSGINNIDFSKLDWKCTDLNGMFQNCTGITAIDLSGLTTPTTTTRATITNMFSGCTNLETANLNWKNFSFGNSGSVFNGCTNLERVCLRLDYIQSTSGGSTNIFQNCSQLQELILPGSELLTVSSIGSFAGSGIANGTCTIYVADDLLDTYKTATNWVTYASQIKAISEYPDARWWE